MLLKTALGIACVGLFAVNWQYQKQWRSNLALTEAVLAHHPCSYQALVGYVQEHRLAGNLPTAEPQINRLVERFPDSMQTWYLRALLMDRLDRPAEVLEAFDRCVRLAGPNPLPSDLYDARNRARRVLAGPTQLPP
jgi:hypothetical protein